MAGRVAALAALAGAIDDQLKAAKQELALGLVEAGVKQITAELPDGTPVAKVSWVTPDPVAVVVDEDAFRWWVKAIRPDQVETKIVSTVRPAYVKALLAEVSAAGVPQWCDTETGEIHTVPGVAMQGRTPYQRNKFEDAGKEAIAAAWRAGTLQHLVLPELEEGGK